VINVLLVGSGGFIGSALRYLIGSGIQNFFIRHRMPYGTIFVNILGCLIIGFIGGISDGKDWMGQKQRLFFFLGILGGFTTFSSFGYDTVNLFRSDAGVLGFTNVIAHIILGLGAVWAGLQLSRLVH